MTAETRALALINSLAAGVSFNIPVVDISSDVFNLPADFTTTLFLPVRRVEISELTQGTVEGDGAFDILMKAAKSHIRAEYDAGRITGSEYTKAYTSMLEAAMANATQFVLQKDNSYWGARRAQIEAIIARAELEKQKLAVAMVQIEANTAKANYARTVLSLATAEMEYEKANFEVTELLPKQLEKLGLENILLATQDLKLKAETQLACAQKHNIDAQTLLEPKKGHLLDEQIEATRAQTLDDRRDGSQVVGSIGKQKALYTQQIIAYERDSEVKAARIFTDAWITQKTIDEGLTAPTGFTNLSVDQVLTTIKAKNGLTGSVTPSAPPIA